MKSEGYPVGEKRSFTFGRGALIQIQVGAIKCEKKYENARVSLWLVFKRKKKRATAPMKKKTRVNERCVSLALFFRQPQQLSSQLNLVDDNSGLRTMKQPPPTMFSSRGYCFLFFLLSPPSRYFSLSLFGHRYQVSGRFNSPFRSAGLIGGSLAAGG